MISYTGLPELRILPDFRHFALQIGTNQYYSKHAFFLKAPTPPPKLEYSKLNLNIAYKFLHYCYNLLYAAWHAVRAVCSILCINDTLSHVRVFCVCIVHNTYDIVTAFMQLNALNLLFLGKRYKNFQRLGASLPGPRHSPPVATFWPPTFFRLFLHFWMGAVIQTQLSMKLSSYNPSNQSLKACAQQLSLIVLFVSITWKFSLDAKVIILVLHIVIHASCF